MSPLPIVDTVLLCPKNDEESLQILKLAETFEIPTVVSDQPHGARLELEPDLQTRLQATAPQARHVVIVEIPGPEAEEALKQAGYRVSIIDHHRYDDLNRMQTISSLEQFLVQFDITDEKLTDHDLEPLLIRGVGLIDRGFLWELSAEGIDPKDAKRIREYYLSLMSELGGIPDRLTQAAKQAWEAKVKHGDVFVVRSPVTEGHIREALSFLVADLFDQPPQILILEGDGRMTLQDSDLAPKLHEAFGGFTFGKDKCWGFAPEDGKPAPSLESILQILH